MRIRGAVLFVLALIPSAAWCQEHCASTDTPRQCVTRLFIARVYGSVQQQVAEGASGPSSVSSPVRSAVKDFLSAASAQFNAASVKDNGKALIIDFNPSLPLFGAPGQLNLEATLADPVASPAAAAAAQSNPGAAAAIQQLGRGDDVSAALSYNLVSTRFGRGLEAHRALLDELLQELIGSALPATAAVPAASVDTPFAKIFPDPAAQLTAITEYQTVAQALPPAAEQLKTDLARLSGDQPQLYVSALDHYRKRLIGPSERGAQLSWEIGSDNLNSFRRGEGRECEARHDCLIALNDYVARTAKQHRSWRLTLSAAYYATNANPVTEAGYAEKATHGMRYSAIIGQELTSFLSGRQGRVDVTWVHQRGKTTHTTTTMTESSRVVSEVFLNLSSIEPSSTRQSLAVTFTQPVSKQVSIPLSVLRTDRLDSLPCLTTSHTSPSVCVPGVRNEHKVAVIVGVRYAMPQFSVPSPPQPQKKDCCCAPR